MTKKTNGLPSPKVGANVRIKLAGLSFDGARGSIIAYLGGALWSVQLAGFVGASDFSAREFTVLD